MNAFERLTTLGRGSFGVTLLVKDKASGAKLALKQVKLGRLTPEMVCACKRETGILKSLKHPCVIRFVASFTHRDNTLCLVMEYADGGDLRQSLNSRLCPFLEKEASVIFIQILLALSYVHSQHVLWRDLKPSNVFLTRRGAVKIGDFGVSRRIASSSGLAQTQVGTPIYCAPEVIEGRDYGSKCDMWSLGCLCFEMCSGKPPFDGRNLGALVHQICHKSPAPWPTNARISRPTRELVARMLSKKAEERPSAKEALHSRAVQHHCERLLGGMGDGQPGEDIVCALLRGQRGAQAQAERSHRAPELAKPSKLQKQQLPSPQHRLQNAVPVGDRLQKKQVQDAVLFSPPKVKAHREVAPRTKLRAPPRPQREMGALKQLKRDPPRAIAAKHGVFERLAVDGRANVERAREGKEDELGSEPSNIVRRKSRQRADSLRKAREDRAQREREHRCALREERLKRKAEIAEESRRAKQNAEEEASRREAMRKARRAEAKKRAAAEEREQRVVERIERKQGASRRRAELEHRKQEMRAEKEMRWAEAIDEASCSDESVRRAIANWVAEN